eukprot:41825-Eustigmatos_ZCMA.PRE.1
MHQGAYSYAHLIRLKGHASVNLWKIKVGLTSSPTAQTDALLGVTPRASTQTVAHRQQGPHSSCDASTMPQCVSPHTKLRLQPCSNSHA